MSFWNGCFPVNSAICCLETFLGNIHWKHSLETLSIEKKMKIVGNKVVSKPDNVSKVLFGLFAFWKMEFWLFSELIRTRDWRTFLSEVLKHAPSILMSMSGVTTLSEFMAEVPKNIASESEYKFQKIHKSVSDSVSEIMIEPMWLCPCPQMTLCRTKIVRIYLSRVRRG